MAVISVQDVQKKFKVYYDKGQTFKERLLFRNRNYHESRCVLKGVSFEVGKGEAIGLVGHNGCGKSTLLKLMTRIMYPDAGSIQIQGRVSSLIELGAGFHPDMSGRENIYTNASIFGLTRKEIDARIADIIAFSELEEFIDNPVRTYSSGMYMRLAFSVAINVDADVLLIDEILSVGDVNFQAKCFERLQSIKKRGTTIVIVSHSLPQIEQICDRSYWIEDGVIRKSGIPKYVHEAYLSSMEGRRITQVEEDFRESIGQQEALWANAEQAEHQAEGEIVQVEEADDPAEAEALPFFCLPESIRLGNRWVEFKNVRVFAEDGTRKNVFKTNEKMVIKMNYVSARKNLEGNFGIGIFRDDGVHCYGTNVLLENDAFVPIHSSGEITATLANNNLLPGKYMLDVAVHSATGTLFDDIRNVFSFQMVSGKRDIGVCRLQANWSIDGTDKERVEEPE